MRASVSVELRPAPSPFPKTYLSSHPQSIFNAILLNWADTAQEDDKNQLLIGFGAPNQQTLDIHYLPPLRWLNKDDFESGAFDHPATSTIGALSR
jgi:hypothetical protein